MRNMHWASPMRTRAARGVRPMGVRTVCKSEFTALRGPAGGWELRPDPYKGAYIRRCATRPEIGPQSLQKQSPSTKLRRLDKPQNIP